MKKIWRIVKLIPIIIKNLFLIGFEELMNLVRRFGWKLWLAVAVLAGIAGGGIWAYRYYFHPDTGNPNDYLTLEEAADMGETKTWKLMIQIETPKGRPEDLKGRYQRGDIVLILPEDHQFSAAEKSGFLIVKMDLTQKQTELLTMSLDEIKKEKDDAGVPLRETLKRRKYVVDLEKMGIAPNDEHGREIADKAFKWDEAVRVKES